MKKKLKLFIPLLTIPIGVLTPFMVASAVVSCSSTKTPLPYDGSYESLKNIADSIENSEFSANLNLNLNDVKETDIKWKNANLYPQLRYEIFDLEKGDYNHEHLGETYKNAVAFRIKLIDKNNEGITANSKYTYILWPFK